jgi:hypothetical protein
VAAAVVAAVVVAAAVVAAAVDAVDVAADADAALVGSADAAALGASPGVDASLGAKRDRSRLIREIVQAGYDIVDPAMHCVPMKSTRLCASCPCMNKAERPPEDTRAPLDRRKLAIRKKFLALPMLRGGQASCVES